MVALTDIAEQAATFYATEVMKPDDTIDEVKSITATVDEKRQALDQALVVAQKGVLADINKNS